ncbi:MAG TPA: hypothetical protein DC009_01150 [Porphyromonadaceae bacterium]|nr:hypothetical protein [Porphyromonadaceae bacterium]
MDIEILNIGCTLLGTVLGACGTHLFKSGRRKAAAEADRAITDNYEARLADLHKVIDLNNDNEIRHAARVVELNKALDDKTALIRDLNARIFDTQQQNAETLRENTELKLQLAKEKCGTYDCISRQPPTEDTRRAIAAAAKRVKETPKPLHDKHDI